MRIPLSVSVLSLACLATTVSPVSAASISSLQTQLNKALIGLPTAPALDVRGEATINFSSKKITKDGSSGSGNIHFNWNQRKQPIADSKAANVEGRAMIDTFSLKSNEPTASNMPPITLDGPIALQWKVVDKTFYGRVEKLPESISGFIQSLGADPAKFVGTWASLSASDVSATAMSLPTSSITSKITSDLPTMDELAALHTLSSTPIILVRSIEKTWIGADGHALARVRGRINPALLTGLLKLETALISKTDPDRTTKLKTINTQITQIRQALPGIQLAINLDQTTGYITRIEIGGTTTAPQKSCTWDVKTDKEICHNATSLTVRYSVGISFMKDSGAIIVAPMGAIPFKDLIAKPPEEETSSTPDMTQNEPTTTSP